MRAIDAAISAFLTWITDSPFGRFALAIFTTVITIVIIAFVISVLIPIGVIFILLIGKTLLPISLLIYSALSVFFGL